ncbi:MAG: hypothetical protein LWW85_12070 [Marinilabiliales bacterium]|nr:hypothetical protein [Marinilabiliales bacterium]
MKTVATNPKEDLQAIRDIMERSSKFLSLSGLSGVFAGFCALAGATYLWWSILGPNQLNFSQALAGGLFTTRLLSVALTVLVAAFLGAVYFSYRKAGRAGQPLWTLTTRRSLIHFLIPLATGGIFCFVLIQGKMEGLVIPASMVFYGLALVNVGKFTFGELHYLGLIQILLGFLAVYLVAFDLVIWSAGFGIFHIIYGALMYHRYER